MRVEICSSRDEDAAKYIQENTQLGHVVQSDTDQRGITHYTIEIGGETVWRAPDAQFQRISSGIYVFETPLKFKRRDS